MDSSYISNGKLRGVSPLKKKKREREVVDDAKVFDRATWGIVVPFTEMEKAGHGAGLWVVL